MARKTEMTSGSDGVHELVRQRDQLRAWIAKLDEVQGAAASRVTERVRADYQDRLRRVTEDLSAHADEIRRGLDDVRAQLAAAEERRGHAADALEETRLRHLIGELDEGAWDQARQPLEAEAAEAEQAVAQAQAEVERLSTLSGEIEAGDAAQAEQPAEAEPEPEPEPAEPAAEAEEAPRADEASEPAPWEESGALDEPQPAPWESALGDEPQAEPEPEPEPATASAEPAGPMSGEDLAAWISEVEAEAGTAPPAESPRQAEPTRQAEPARQAPQDETTAEGWDPFANEFGGGPASPTTQPGDAAQELPWLGALEGGAGAGRWAGAPAGGDDELAFLDHLEASAAPADEPAASGELADDDLAFLEELDRAISGGSQRTETPPPSSTGLSGNFSGGSGDAVGPAAAEGGDGEPRKQGEALLCKECGAINEPQAWYCEICGSEL